VGGRPVVAKQCRNRRQTPVVVDLRDPGIGFPRTRARLTLFLNHYQLYIRFNLTVGVSYRLLVYATAALSLRFLRCPLYPPLRYVKV
jgi:hypothetical protein